MSIKGTIRGKKGISVPAIIALIIVAIFAFSILRMIIRYMGGNKFSKFKSDFSDYQDTIGEDYVSRKSAASTQVKDEQIYYAIANGVEVSESTDVIATGNVNELGIQMSPSGLTGGEFYEITNDANIAKINGKKKFYESSEKHYLTDRGEAFILPGFLNEEDGVKKWYVNENKYYESKNPITDITPFEVTNIKITKDVAMLDEAGEDLKKGTKLYISFDATLLGKSATVTPEVPFEVVKNGTYQFTLSSSGRTINRSINVQNYRDKELVEIVKVGDYVDYIADEKTYTPTKDSTGYSNRAIKTEKMSWRVIDVNKENNKVLIMPVGITNNKVTLSGAIGYVNGPEILNTICKNLYSNSKLGLEARNMTIEDINKIFQKEAETPTIMKAYYPRGTSISGTIEYSGETYIKATNDWRMSRFYTNNGGGVEKTDEHGFKYNEPEEDNPVFIKQNHYIYKVTPDNTISSILGGYNAWLASQSTYIGNSGVGYSIRTMSSQGVNADILYDTLGNTYNSTYSIQPVVEISSDNYMIDLNDKNQDGASSNAAWKILKENSAL